MTSTGGDWTHCLYCGAALTSPVSRHDGFGSSCYVKLDRGERSRIVAAAVRAREQESECSKRLGRFRWRLAFIAVRFGWRGRH